MAWGAMFANTLRTRWYAGLFQSLNSLPDSDDFLLARSLPLPRAPRASPRRTPCGRRACSSVASFAPAMLERGHMVRMPLRSGPQHPPQRDVALRPWLAALRLQARQPLLLEEGETPSSNAGSRSTSATQLHRLEQAGARHSTYTEAPRVRPPPTRVPSAGRARPELLPRALLRAAHRYLARVYRRVRLPVQRGPVPQWRERRVHSLPPRVFGSSAYFIRR